MNFPVLSLSITAAFVATYGVTGELRVLGVGAVCAALFFLLRGSWKLVALFSVLACLTLAGDDAQALILPVVVSALMLGIVVFAIAMLFRPQLLDRFRPR